MENELRLLSLNHTTLESLPPELLDYILAFLPESSLTPTALALLYALPNSRISHANLWRHLQITREGQAADINRRSIGLKELPITVNVEAWREDPQALVDLLRTFTRVHTLSLTIGPLATPEIIDGLLDGSRLPKFSTTLQQLSFRFNPYVTERSYYTFLKGAYFDSIPLALATWPRAALKRVSFVQDLPPMHGAPPKDTPAFGLFRNGPRRIDGENPMDFAQPIIFFRLACIGTLATSQSGSTIENLILRLPRRDPIPAITTFPHVTHLPNDHFAPFPSLTQLDLSTAHILLDARLPLLLRLYPRLEYLILDRCTGIIGPQEIDESTAVQTLRSLGKLFGNQGILRAQDGTRSWLKILKERPIRASVDGNMRAASGETSAEPKKKRVGRSGYGNMPRAQPVAPVIQPTASLTPMATLVKEIIIIPPPSTLKGLGFGLFEIEQRVDEEWRSDFQAGYLGGKERLIDAIEAGINRWKLWSATGKLDAGDRRLVTYRDGIPADSSFHDQVDSPETDEAFARFCRMKNLVAITPIQAQEILAVALDCNVVFCTQPDCSGAAGTPHLALSEMRTETLVEREAKEKLSWEKERLDRRKWRRGAEEHQAGCAHLVSRGSWSEEE